MPYPKLDPTDETTRLGVRIPTRLEEQLQRLADIETTRLGTKRTISDVARDALTAHLEKAPPAA